MMKNHSPSKPGYPRNISLGYVLIALNSILFWFAPWLLFLYDYINVAQATVLQAIGLASAVISEIPSGVISDLFGKKKTMLIGFGISSLSEILIGFSNEYWQFIVLWILLSIGKSFLSGTTEAFMYDSLVEKKMESSYPHVVSRMQLWENGAIAISSIIGGVIFAFWPPIVFLLTGVFKAVAFVVALFISEPSVDTEVFSLKQFVRQSKMGFHHLFSRKLLSFTLLILIYGSFMIIAYEIMDDVAMIDWGFSAAQIGLIYAAATLMSLPAGLLYERAEKLIGPFRLVLIGIVILGLNYVFAPWIPAWIFVLGFFARVIYSPIQFSAVSSVINTNTPSAIRATTLSTYELMRKIPYVLTAVLIGDLILNIGFRWYASWFAMLLLGSTLLFGIVQKKK